MGPFEQKVNSLCEFFDAPFETRWVHGPARDKSVYFEVPSEDGDKSVKYQINFSQEDIEEVANSQNVGIADMENMFAELGIDIPSSFRWRSWDTFIDWDWDIYQIDFGIFGAQSMKQKYGITGSGGGNASRVFATVIDAINRFVYAQRPDMFYFTANEPSRRKLYRALIRRFKSSLYKIIENGGLTVFALKSEIPKMRDAVELGLETWRE